MEPAVVEAVKSSRSAKPRPVPQRRSGVTKLSNKRTPRPTEPHLKCGRLDYYYVRTENRWTCRYCKNASGRRRKDRDRGGTPLDLLCSAHRNWESTLRAHPDQALVHKYASIFLRDRKFNPRIAHFFPKIHPSLAKRLVASGANLNVGTCATLSEIRREDQGQYLDLYERNPIDAKRWACLAPWKRPIRDKTPENEAIWKAFTILRLWMERAATDGVDAWSLASQGHNLRQLAGALGQVKDTTKLQLVLSGYGGLLADGKPPENRSTPPWEEVRELRIPQA